MPPVPDAVGVDAALAEQRRAVRERGARHEQRGCVHKHVERLGQLGVKQPTQLHAAREARLGEAGAEFGGHAL
eukprot:4493373-Prymnesium_polylepis.2